MLILNLLSQPLYLVAFLAALIIGITAHEFAHAWAANNSGDPTAKIEGRLTLNPLAHLDPLGTLFIFLAGFGWGKPTPINPSLFRHRSDELKVAFAGIIMNLITAFVLAIPLRIATMYGIVIESSPILLFLEVIVEFNIMLAAFNILPIPPLDGSHILEYFLGEPVRRIFELVGPYLLIMLVIFDRFGSTSILNTLIEPIIRSLSLIIKGAPPGIF